MIAVNMFRIVLSLFGFLSFSSYSLATESIYDIELISATTLNYDPFSGQEERETFKFRVLVNEAALEDLDNAREVNRGRQLRLRFRSIDNRNIVFQNGSQNLPLEVTPSGNSRGFRSSAREFYQNFTLRNSLRPVEFEFEFGIPASLYADPGEFLLPFDVDLVDVASNMVLNSLELEVRALVELSLQFNIAGGSVNRNTISRFTLVDFGELETSESQRLSLQIRGNSSADIRLTSENNGTLQHVDEEDLSIDYSVTVDGAPSTLARPFNLIRAVDPVISGSAYPIQITVGEVEGAFAGAYRDIITVEVRPTP